MLRRVRPTVAFAMMHDNREMPIVDLRRPEEYWGPLGHINGSRNLPLEQLDWRLLELGDLKEQTFMIYCRADDCVDRGMELLVASGFENAVMMDGGIEGWIDDGFGTVGIGLGIPPPKPPPCP